MRVHLVLALSVGLVVVLLVRGLLSTAPTLAGNNRVTPASFVDVVPAGSVVCQATAPLPDDATAAQITIGTYRRAVAVIELRFLSASRAVSAEGRASTGPRDGPVTVALRRPPGAPPASRFCLRFAGRTRVALAGLGVPPGPNTAAIDGNPQAAVVSVTYLRRSRESWASLVPRLIERFGRGKATFFGDWALPACALALVVAWILTIRLIGRELA